MHLLLLAWCLQTDPQFDPQAVRIRSGPYTPSPPSIAVQTYLVELGVTVKDHHGNPVSGLTAADFELTDNGKPQTIKFFSEQKSSEPRTIATPAAKPTAQPAAQPPPTRSILLFFDDTHTADFALQKGRLAAKKFLSEAARPGDRFAILTASGAPSVDFTADTQVLLAALDKLKPHPGRGDRGLSNCPTLNPYQAYAIDQGIDYELKRQKVAEAIACDCGPQPTKSCIAAQDGLVQGAAASAWSIYRPESVSFIDGLAFALRHLASAPGSRLMLMVSPGFVSGSLEQKTSAPVDRALRARIVVNALDSTGLSTNRSQGLQSPVLGELMSTASIATGGKFIHNNNDLTGGLRQLAEPAPDSYLMGFSPTSAPNDKYHRLNVKLKNPSAGHVESRPGYFSTKPGPQPETIQQRIERLAASKETIEQIPATVRLSGAVQVDISVDLRHLKFSEQSGRHVQQLTFVTLVLDPSGNIIQGKQAVIDLALKPAKLADLQAKGLHAVTSFTLPKGSYRIREVIREALENHFTAQTVPLP